MEVSINNLTKKYGDLVAVDGIDITAEKGELTTLVGPSGCGKTTTLRAIAGLEEPTEGEIVIGDEVVANPREGTYVPTQQRDVGFVFQTFDVWPHMDVYENVAFPMRIRDYTEDEIDDAVENILDLANISELEDKNATDLSGGQQARVSICRALVYEPRILLCDEPLTGLDRNLRHRMRYEIRRLQTELDITTVYVTHSQPEAMTMSDKIALMNTNGKVEQVGTTTEIYNEPVSRYAFDFFGTSQFLSGNAAGENEVRTGIGSIIHNRDVDGSTDVTVGFRPEEVEISHENHADWQQNTWTGTIDQYSFLGETHEFGVSIDGEQVIARQSRLSEDFEEGDPVHVHLDPDKVFVFEDGT